MTLSRKLQTLALTPNIKQRNAESGIFIKSSLIRSDIQTMQSRYVNCDQPHAKHQMTGKCLPHIEVSSVS